MYALSKSCTLGTYLPTGTFLLTQVLLYKCLPYNSGVCNLPLNTGEGDIILQKYYYDKDADMCSSFAYKGSEGNDNKFKTKGACELTCRPFSPEGQEALRGM